MTESMYVLVLTDPDEGDLLGIWGPYHSEEEANVARNELLKWPMQPGDWEIVALKQFPPVNPPYTGIRGGGSITWSNGDFYSNNTTS